MERELDYVLSNYKICNTVYISNLQNHKSTMYGKYLQGCSFISLLQLGENLSGGNFQRSLEEFGRLWTWRDDLTRIFNLLVNRLLVFGQHLPMERDEHRQT